MKGGAGAAGVRTPQRIQRKRTRGWRMPANTVYVGRPTRWGNPWTLDAYWDAGYSGSARRAAEVAVDLFRAWMTQTRSLWGGSVPGPEIHAPWDKPGVTRTPPDLSALRGKDLACWCALVDEEGNRLPCHADVLLELANCVAASPEDARS